MGRPKDTFWWDLANKLPDGSLSCKYCSKKYKGGVSRIKLHLSGKGGNIGPCKGVPPEIQKQAEDELQGYQSVGEGNRDKPLKPNPMKRGRHTSAGEDSNGVNVANTGDMSSLAAIRGEALMGGNSNGVNVANTRDMSSLAANAMVVSPHNQASSSSSLNDSLSNVFKLVMFFMSRNTSVDAFRDSHFWSLLANVAQPGLQSWLQVLDGSAIIQKSLSNFEHEMNQYMQWVRKSWETTGCTLILYDLNEGKGKVSALDKYNLVAGFYCPRGFIFVELELQVRQKYCCDLFPELGNALKNHDVDLSIDDVVQIIWHDGPSHIHKHKCQYQACDKFMRGRKISPCMRRAVHSFWKYMCDRSVGLQNLINKTDDIYQSMFDSPTLHGKSDRTLEQKSFEEVGEGNYESYFSRLRSIMELRKRPSNGIVDDPLVMQHDEFWSDGKDVLQFLAPLFQIPDLIDSLLPTAGYFEQALYKAEDVLNTCNESSKLFGTWQVYLGWATIDYKSSLRRRLSPSHLTNHDFKWELFFFPDQKAKLRSLVTEEEGERIEAELRVYICKTSNPFANISSSECKLNHPVKLWEKYGGDFPLLQKCATKIFSQPISCLCNQVHKCMSRLHGLDNFMLRLNVMMMEEFRKLGDEVYQSIDVESIFNKHREHIAAL